MSRATLMSRVGTLFIVLLAALWVAPIALVLRQMVSFEALSGTLTQTMALRWTANGLFTSVTVTLLVIALCAPCAYAFSKIDFPGSRLLYWVFLAGLFIPREALFVPLFILMNDLNALDTYQGIILPQLIAPIAIVVFKQYFDAVDSALHDAATIEGASGFRIFSRIYLPLNQGVAWALAIYIFIGSWNNFFWPFLVVFSDEMNPLAVGLADAYSFMVLAVTIIVAVLATFFAQYRFRSETSRVAKAPRA